MVVKNDKLATKKLINEAGEVVIPEGYDIKLDQSGYFYVEKNGLVGLYDRLGKKLFEANNLSIQIEWTNTDSLIWVKKELSAPYLEYDFKGTRLTRSTYLQVGSRLPFVPLEQFKQSIVKGNKIQLADGSIIDSSYLKDYKLEYGGSDKKQPFLVGNNVVLDKQLRNVIPKDMKLFSIDYKNERITLQDREGGRGLIDRNGNWLIRPKSCFLFEEIGKMLVYREPYSKDGNNGRLFIIGKNKVDSIAIYKYRDNVVAEERTALKLKHNLDIFRSMRTNLIDSAGNYLTNFPLSNKLLFDGEKYFFTYATDEQNPKAPRKSRIVDRRGKTIRELPGFELAMPVTKRAFVIVKNNKYGLLDVINNNFVEAKYEYIRPEAIMNDSVFLFSTNINNQKLFLDQNGKPVDLKIPKLGDKYLAPTNFSNEASTKSFLAISLEGVADSGSTNYFYDEKFKLLSSVNGTLASRIILLSDRYVKVKTKSGADFYFDIISGISYKE